MSPAPRIVRGLSRKQCWTVYEPSGDLVASYRTRDRARRWCIAAGYTRWTEESWVQRRCTGTPRAVITTVGIPTGDRA